MITASYRSEVQRRNRTFRLDDETREHITAAAKWLIGESRSGLLLCGNCGNGKTTLLRALRAVIAVMTSDEPRSEQRCMRIIAANDIVRINRDSNSDTWNNLRSFPILAIDDAGEEAAEVINYGNVQQPIVEILSYRYENMLPTLMSTNMDPKNLHNHYGNRIADRMKEVMEKIIFAQPSYRAQ